MLSTLQFLSMGHVFGFWQRKKHNLPAEGHSANNYIKETYFGLCVRLHSSSGIGITQAHLAMNGIETQLGFFQNDFEEQPLF